MPRCLGACVSVIEAELAGAAQAHGRSAEIIVVDDASTDKSADVVKAQFPDVRLVQLQKRGGFPGAANAGAKEAKNELVLFLNSDVVVQPGFLGPLLEEFDDATVFAAGGKLLVPAEGMLSHSLCRLEFRKGTLFFRWPQEDASLDLEKRQAALYLPAACLLVNREKFLDAGGFDEIFAPYYFEDLDLCYRAWKRGWKTIYKPLSAVEHLSSATIDSQSSAAEKTIIFHRNSLIFLWKNIDDWGMLLSSLAWLPLHMVAAVIHGRLCFLSAVSAALQKLPEALRKRRRYTPPSFSDSALLKEFDRVIKR